MKIKDDDKLLKVGEAAERLGVKTSTLYNWAYQRRIAVVKVGRCLRFRESTVRRMVAAERPVIKGNGL